MAAFTAIADEFLFDKEGASGHNCSSFVGNDVRMIEIWIAFHVIESVQEGDLAYTTDNRQLCQAIQVAFQEKDDDFKNIRVILVPLL